MSGARVILTFSSTHRTIAAEEALLEGEIAHQIVPLPSWVRAGCGLALRLEADVLGRALEILETAGTAVEGVHRLPSDQPGGDSG